MRTGAAILLIALAGGAALPFALTTLHEARLHRADIMAAAGTSLPASPIPTTGGAFVDRADATNLALKSTIRELAQRERTLLERIDIRPSPAPGLALQHAIISGDARAILRVVEAIESRSPLVRMPQYRLAANASGRSLRLEADIVMAFNPP